MRTIYFAFLNQQLSPFQCLDKNPKSKFNYFTFLHIISNLCFVLIIVFIIFSPGKQNQMLKKYLYSPRFTKELDLDCRIYIMLKPIIDFFLKILNV